MKIFSGNDVLCDTLVNGPVLRTLNRAPRAPLQEKYPRFLGTRKLLSYQSPPCIPASEAPRTGLEAHVLGHFPMGRARGETQVRALNEFSRPAERLCHSQSQPHISRYGARREGLFSQVPPFAFFRKDSEDPVRQHKEPPGKGRSCLENRRKQRDTSKMSRHGHVLSYF